VLNFRELVATVVPPWLRRRVGGALMYAFALHFDALAELVTAAVKLRFPGVYSAESLPLLSRERRIRQGLGESDASFAERMNTFLATHRDRGGPYPMLEQIFAHYRYSADGAFPVHLVYTSGARFDMGTDGVITRAAASFLTGLGADEWAHWWLIYEWPTTVHSDGLWGDAGAWGDGGVWGCDLTAVQVTDLRLIPAEWNNAHCKGHLILLSPGQALWGAPEETWGETVGGTWGDGTATDPIQVEIE
jgi:hypothetical protein